MNCNDNYKCAFTQTFLMQNHMQQQKSEIAVPKQTRTKRLDQKKRKKKIKTNKKEQQKKMYRVLSVWGMPGHLDNTLGISNWQVA